MSQSQVTNSLSLRGIVKSFFGVPVIKSLDLALVSGEILGIVGQNGAGKSTLMNIIGGNLSPDCGEMQLNGAPYSPRSSRDALRAGVGFVHQELNLFPNLTVAENLFLHHPPTFARCIRRGEMNRAAQSLLTRVGLALDPRTLVARLSAGEQQLVELARVLAADSHMLLLDEPTTSLSDRETAHFFRLIRQLANEGHTVVLITHAIGDVLRHCDRVAVLRDGELIADGPCSTTDSDTLVRHMIGRPAGQLFPTRTSAPSTSAPVLLSVDHLSQPQTISDITFDLRQGEVLGLFGLMGAGRSELARMLVGLDRYASGRVAIAGKTVRGGHHAIGFVTENRRFDGLLPESSVVENMSLVALDRYSSKLTGWLRQRKMTESINAMRDSVQLQERLLNAQLMKTLSGGNQQKAILGKWLLNDPLVLIFDEPTRGIDVAAKFDVYQLIQRFADQGRGALVISSDLEELIGICDRILVMSLGRLTGEFVRPDFDRERMLAAAFAHHLRTKERQA